MQQALLALLCFDAAGIRVPLQVHLQGNASWILASASNTTVTGFSASQADESVLVRNFADILYTVELHVGRHHEPFRALVDTGSSNLWLKEMPMMDPEPGKRVVHVTYGMGEVFAVPASDRICMASICVRQEFLLAVSIRGMGENLPLFDGLLLDCYWVGSLDFNFLGKSSGFPLNAQTVKLLQGGQQQPRLGLAFPGMLDVGRATFLQDLGAAGHFVNLGFGLALRGTEGESFIELGEVPELIRNAESRTSSKGVTLDVRPFEAKEATKLLFWMVSMSLCVARGQNFRDLVLNLTGSGVVDSGTSLLLLPMHAYQQTMWALTVGTKMERHVHDGLVPCDDADLNHLTLQFPGKDGELLISLTTADLLLPAGESFGRKICKIGLAPSQSFPHMVLGDIFLRKVSAIHDMQGPSLTLVPDLGFGARPGVLLSRLGFDLGVAALAVPVVALALAWRRAGCEAEYRELPAELPDT